MRSIEIIYPPPAERVTTVSANNVLWATAGSAVVASGAQLRRATESLSRREDAALIDQPEVD